LMFDSIYFEYDEAQGDPQDYHVLGSDQMFRLHL
jgi:hypothetical protein